MFGLSIAHASEQVHNIRGVPHSREFHLWACTKEVFVLLG